MKRIIFLITIFTFLFSCSSNKNLNHPPVTTPHYYKSKYFISPDSANAMIGNFRKHKRRWLLARKKQLDSSYATFEPNLLSQIVNDGDMPDVKFVLVSGIIKKDSDYRWPTVLLQVTRHANSGGNAKGSGVENMVNFAAPEYYRPVGLCPPPPGSCRVQPY